MNYALLGNTSEKVSTIGLGTMMWGEQVDEEEAFQQMHLALEHGVNLWDTAEMYTIPAKPETQGNTERIIGNFFQKNPEARKHVFLASKVAGKGTRQIPWIREGNQTLTEANIRNAVEGSLQRLKTNVIDLYQVHWPERVVPLFGSRTNEYPQREEDVSIEETLTTLTKLVHEGKIRYIGVSNETPWGTMEWLRLAREKGLERIVSIQNAYSLLARQFELGLAEISLREEVGLLAYSPLAMGVLSGKYLHNGLPKGSRRELFEGYASRYASPRAEQAVEKYVHIAKKYNLDVSQMALAYLLQKPFVASVLVGATSCTQLISNIQAVHLRLSPEVLLEIESVYAEIPDPCV